MRNRIVTWKGQHTCRASEGVCCAGRSLAMLVLSRRAHEKIVFPAFNTSVEVLEVKPGRVRLGIDAPANVQILREEVMDPAQTKQAGAATFQRLLNVTAEAN